MAATPGWGVPSTAGWSDDPEAGVPQAVRRRIRMLKTKIVLFIHTPVSGKG
jgi:hypothetical protein